MDKLIKSIKVGSRFRKDLGDVDSLAASIRERGLLHPVVVTSDGRLVAGERRLAAVKSLGWKEVPVRVVKGLDEAVAFLKAERDENTCREDFAPTEAVALGRELERLERPKAKKRQKEHGKTAPGKPKDTSGNLPEVKGETRDKVGEGVGMSGRTYEKAKAVVEAAEAEPEKFGQLAEEMDQKGSVNGAYRKLQEARQPPPREPPPPQYPHSDRLYRWLRTVAADTEVIKHELGGIEALLAERDKWDWHAVEGYILTTLESVQKTIGHYLKEVKHALQQK